MLTTKTGAGLVSGVAPEPNEGPKMEIKVIRGFVWEGKDIKAGTTLEVSEKFARQMIHLGRAQFISNEAPKKKVGRPKKIN